MIKALWVSERITLYKWKQQDFTWENIKFSENIMTQHHYTDTEVKTAAAAANAGTCLEDGNSQKNIFSNVGDAVKAVRSETMFIYMCER